MKFLLLAALLGLSSALQSGFEYTYRYRGSITLGIPDISSQVATSAFYCDAKVQVIDNNEMKMQFFNIFIGDMNDRVTCEDKRSPSDGYESIQFEALSEFKDQLEKPFGVKMEDVLPQPYQFPDSDEVWMRNIRRAFIQLLHLPTNAPSLELSNPIGNFTSFNRVEHHPLGECLGWYTVTPLKEYLQKYYLPDPLENDVQGDLQNDYWHLSKFVEFDNCTDVVSSHTFGTMLPGKFDNEKCGEDYVSTATTGFYVLKGGPRGVRLEKAVLEGTYIIDYDNVHTYSNQTLDLRSVDAIGAPFDVAGSFYSFKHEIHAFSWMFDKSSGSKVNKGDSVKEIKSYAKQRFEEGADALSTGQPFNFAEDMEAISTAAGFLSKDDLQEIYDSLSGDARSLFMKALTASGLEIPYLFLMEKLKGEYDDTSHANKLDMLLNAVQNVKTTELIQPIMNMVMNWEVSDFLRGMGIVNFATLATRMCTNPCGRQYLGETGCQIHDCKELVENTYLPWLEQGLNDESNSLWERIVYMTAIYNFNSEKILPIVRPYVIGSKDVDFRLRVIAIYALRKDDMPSSTKNEVLQGLMAVFDNYQEHYRLREAAFAVMLFWDPEPSWWHYMAVNSWRDPNNYVVNLISNAIYTFKEYSPAAKRVVGLTKPVHPRSMSRSWLVHKKVGNNDMMRYWYEFVYSGNDMGIFPRMFSAYVRLGLIDTNFDPLKLVSHFDNFNMLQFFWKTIVKMFGKIDWKPVVGNFDEVKALYDDIIAKLEMETKEPAKYFEAFFHMTIFNNFQAIKPLKQEFGDVEFTPEFFMALLGSIDINRQFFINSGTIGHAYATEIGIPVMTEYTQPKFFSFIGKSSLSQSGSKTSVNFDMKFRFDRYIGSRSKGLIPWMGKSMVSGIDKRQLLVMPFNFQITYDSETTEFTVDATPNDKSTKEHFGIYNEPFTVRAPMVSPKRMSALEDFKPIRKQPKVFQDDLIFPGTGLNLGAVFVGDVQPLFSRGNANNYYASFFQNTDYQSFPPTNKYYQYKIGADYSKSDANRFSVSAQYVKGDKAAKDYVAIPGADSTYVVSGLRFKVIFRKDDGSSIRKFGAEFTWANGWTPRFESKVHWQVQKSEYESESASTRCIYVHTSSPRILAMITPRDFLDMDHATKVKAQTFYGVNDCTSQPLMEIDGEMTLSDGKKERLGNELPTTDCKNTHRNTNNYNMLSYDKMSFTMKWQELYQDQQAKFPLASYFVTYFIPGIMFPKAYWWYEQNDSPANTATFEAYKQSEGWNFKFTKPYINAVGDRVQIPQFVEEFLITPRPDAQTMYYKYLVGYDRPTCYATASQVKTFDDLTINHSLGTCWTVAIWDCKQNSGLVNVRNNGGFEAYILWTVEGLRIDINKDQVKINNEVIEAGTVTGLYQVHQVSQGMQVDISWIASVRVTIDGISVEGHPIFKGSLCGLCGNFDGGVSTIAGPKGCSYSDHDLFMAAWTMPGDACDVAALATKKDQVKTYQTSCPKQFVYSTGKVLTSMQESCYEYKYDVQTKGDYTCTSTERVSTCKPGCTSAIPYNDKVMYNCVASDAAENKKQTVRGLAVYPTPGCHYFQKWWYIQSTGCEI